MRACRNLRNVDRKATFKLLMNILKQLLKVSRYVAAPRGTMELRPRTTFPAACTMTFDFHARDIRIYNQQRRDT